MAYRFDPETGRYRGNVGQYQRNEDDYDSDKSHPDDEYYFVEEGSTSEEEESTSHRNSQYQSPGYRGSLHLPRDIPEYPPRLSGEW